MEVILSIGVGYLLGSLIPGLWIARWRGIDIRQVGSGNIGSTNVYRTMGWWAGLIVQVIDIGKGLAALWTAQLLNVSSVGLYLTATAAVLGHIYPIWAQFQGGKGINTLLGSMLGIEPLSALAALGTFLMTLSFSRIVSLSSLVGVGSFLLWHGVVGSGDTVGYIAGAFWMGLVIYTHRTNIQRLIAGTEPVVGRRKS
ncbi:MAG: glycerol-3-phosphate 1-O-acyltransferase PlsY [Bacteroidia bacterium]|nr:glycerol-3-phosphate 1-O-acyltransferase PlsY [Bacteroidia bacterium]